MKILTTVLHSSTRVFYLLFITQVVKGSLNRGINVGKCEWLALTSDCFTRSEKAPGTYLIGG